MSASPAIPVPDLPPDRRGQFLNAAACVFAERGYETATIKDIATLAGTAPGTIYLYFANKRELLMAIADRLVSEAAGQTAARLDQLARIEDDDPEAYIDFILRDLLRFMRENEALLGAIVAQIWTDRDLQEQFLAHVVQPVFATGSRYLQERIESGQLRPFRVDVVLPAIIGSLVMLTALRGLPAGELLIDLPHDQIVAELTRLFSTGLQQGQGSAAA